MTKIIGVRFKPAGKMYYFDPQGYDIKRGMNVIVETSRGMEYGEVVQGAMEVSDTIVTKPLKGVVRIASDDDTARRNENIAKEQEAYDICIEKIKKHELDMKLVEVEYTYDRSKIIFYFTSDGRVDFRELVKDLAAVFKTRIELRQIGVRDESKSFGSIGMCGRGLCCSQFLGEFASVSIKMAKEQGLSLNPSKISGVCGRLMCCLQYEQDTYEALLAESPSVGATVETPGGKGSVVGVSLMRGKVKVKFESETETTLKEFDVDEVSLPGQEKKKTGKQKEEPIVTEKNQTDENEPKETKKSSRRTRYHHRRRKNGASGGNKKDNIS